MKSIPYSGHKALTLPEALDRIAELEELLGIRFRYPLPPPLSGLGPTNRKILGLLIKVPLLDREYAYRAIWGHMAEREQPADLRIVDTHVSRIRRILKHLDINIHVERASGYFLDPQDKKKLQALLDGIT